MKKFLIVTLSMLLILLSVSGVLVYKMLDIMGETVLVDTEGNPLDRRGKGIGTDAPDKVETGIVNILLLGVDRRANEPARTDSMMIASIDKKNKTIKITSLMRDMYVPIPGKNDNRINTAFLFGGPALALKTVNTNFNLDIEDYVAVDFSAFEAIIDQIGGIPIDVKKNELNAINKEISWHNQTNKGTSTSRLTQSGLQTLNGRQALAYSRIRKVGNSDFERTERQRRVLNELFKKSKSIGVTKVPGLVNTILPNVETSLSLAEILDLALAMISFNKPEIEQFRLPADGSFTNEYVNKMLVLRPDLQKNRELLHKFIYDEDGQNEDNE